MSMVTGLVEPRLRSSFPLVAQRLLSHRWYSPRPRSPLFSLASYLSPPNLSPRDPLPLTRSASFNYNSSPASFGRGFICGQVHTAKLFAAISVDTRPYSPQSAGAECLTSGVSSLKCDNPDCPSASGSRLPKIIAAREVPAILIHEPEHKTTIRPPP